MEPPSKMVIATRTVQLAPLYRLRLSLRSHPDFVGSAFLLEGRTETEAGVVIGVIGVTIVSRPCSQFWDVCKADSRRQAAAEILWEQGSEPDGLAAVPPGTAISSCSQQRQPVVRGRRICHGQWLSTATKEGSWLTVDHVEVHPVHRQNGLGIAMVQAALDFASQQHSNDNDKYTYQPWTLATLRVQLCRENSFLVFAENQNNNTGTDQPVALVRYFARTGMIQAGRTPPTWNLVFVTRDMLVQQQHQVAATILAMRPLLTKSDVDALDLFVPLPSTPSASPDLDAKLQTQLDIFWECLNHALHSMDEADQSFRQMEAMIHTNLLGSNNPNIDEETSRETAQELSDKLQEGRREMQDKLVAEVHQVRRRVAREMMARVQEQHDRDTTSSSITHKTSVDRIRAVHQVLAPPTVGDRIEVDALVEVVVAMVKFLVTEMGASIVEPDPETGDTPVHMAAHQLRRNHHLLQWFATYSANSTKKEDVRLVENYRYLRPIDVLVASVPARKLSGHVAQARGITSRPPQEQVMGPFWTSVQSLLPELDASSLLDGGWSPRMRRALQTTAMVEFQQLQDGMDWTVFGPTMDLPRQERDIFRGDRMDRSLWQYIPAKVRHDNPRGFTKTFVRGWIQLWGVCSFLLERGQAPTVQRVKTVVDESAAKSDDGELDDCVDGAAIIVESKSMGENGKNNAADNVYGAEEEWAAIRYYLEHHGKIEYVLDALVDLSEVVVAHKKDGHGWHWTQYGMDIMALPYNPLDEVFEAVLYQLVNRGGGTWDPPDTRGPYQGGGHTNE